MDLRMYILVNKDIKISKGKLAGQVGHASNILTYNYCNGNQELKDIIFNYMQGRIKKIILYADQKFLESLEEKYVTVRDSGLTELEPNTLTCINLGIIDYNNIPNELNFIKKLKLV